MSDVGGLDGAKTAH
jgi:hypothetical protein